LKGLVFTTFYDFCEERLGEEGLDEIIEAANLPHAGGYTSVGTYPFDEMVALITAYVRRSGQSMPEVMGQFGEYCFSCWVRKFPHLFQGRDLFDVLASIDDFHESEVRRLYPDAELPSFKVTQRSDDRMTLGYVSCKPLADLAIGVIRGAGKHLGCPVDVSFVATAKGTQVRVERLAKASLAA
jgi:hypothetical protein